MSNRKKSTIQFKEKSAPAWEPYRIGDRTKSGRNLQIRKEELLTEMGSPFTDPNDILSPSTPVMQDAKPSAIDDMLMEATKKEAPIVSVSPMAPSSPPNDEPAVSLVPRPPSLKIETKPVEKPVAPISPPHLSVATAALSVTLASGIPKSPNGLKMLSIQKKHISEIQKSPGTPCCDNSIFDSVKPEIKQPEMAKPIVPQLSLSLGKPAPSNSLSVNVMSPTVSPKSPNGLRMLNVAKKHVGEIQKSPGTPSAERAPGALEFDLSTSEIEPEPIVLKKRPMSDRNMFATPATPDDVGTTLDNGITIKTPNAGPVELSFNLPLGKITYESPRDVKETARFRELNDELKKKNTEIMELRVMIEQMKQQMEFQQQLIEKRNAEESNSVVQLRSPRNSDNSMSPRSRSRSGNELLVRAIMNNKQ
jgi:hypothetical protein